jgi:hypothetical protein
MSGKSGFTRHAPVPTDPGALCSQLYPRRSPNAILFYLFRDSAVYDLTLAEYQDRYEEKKGIITWGDIDPPGFEILSLLRQYVPESRSIMMDGITLLP